MSEWQFAWGDASGHEALFVRDCGTYAEIIEVTDLDSAVGTTNLVLVETGSVGLDYGLHEMRERVKRAFDSCGRQSLKGLTRANARLLAIAEMWSYGYGDRENSTTIATDREYDEWTGTDRWQVSTYTDDGKVPLRVNGSKGIKRYLARYHDVSVETWPEYTR